MKKNILILYHAPERELVISNMIADEVRRLCPEATVSVDEFYQSYYKMPVYKPDIILSMPPRDKPSSGLLTLIKLQYHPLILSMTTEGSILYTEESMAAAIGFNSYDSHLVDYYCYWGSKIADALGNCLIKRGKLEDPGRIRIFGYAPYDREMIRKYASAPALEEKLQKIKAENRKIMLFTTAFHRADITLDELELESTFPGEIGSPEHTAAREKMKTVLQYDKEYRDLYFDIIMQGAKKHPEIFFIVKLHPIEMASFRFGHENFYGEMKTYPNIFVAEEPVPISLFLNYTDYFFHYGSTAALEAYIYDVPTIQITDEKNAADGATYGPIKFESTEFLDCRDKEFWDHFFARNIQYRDLPGTDEYLYNTMNYKKGTEYHPATWVAQFIAELNPGDAQKLHRGDPATRELLRCLDVKAYWDHQFKTAAKAVLHGKVFTGCRDLFPALGMAFHVWKDYR